MGQWLREWGGEAERAPEGFMRVLTAPFCSDIPGLWDSSKTLHVAKAGQDIHFRILFQLLAVQKARSPVQGEDGSSALVALSPLFFLLRVKGITELEPGLAKDAEGWGPSSKSKGICTPTGTALFSQLPSITPVAFIPASCSCLCHRHSAAPRGLSYLDRLCHEAHWNLD